MARFLFFRSRRRAEARDWWRYFGSFGDDFFGDEAEVSAAAAVASWN